MKIGVIGVGQMGSGMARSLIKAGHEVTVWNRSREKADEIARAGARVAALPAGACGGDAVITMLADDAATEAVVFGADGIISALRPGGIHLAMSTISVALSNRLMAAHELIQPAINVAGELSHDLARLGAVHQTRTNRVRPDVVWPILHGDAPRQAADAGLHGSIDAEQGQGRATMH